jgi:hypothetical protein
MAEPRTIEPGAMMIATSSPFPPFAVARDDTDSGFDAELMRAVCGRLGLRWNLVKHEGDDCKAIFDGLRTGDHDAVVAATTITPDLEMVALVSEPYLTVDQALLVNAVANPHLTSTDDVETEVLGVEQGRTSEALADELLGAGKVRAVRRYPCGGVITAADDASEHCSLSRPWRGGWRPTMTISRSSRRSRRASSSVSRSRRGTRRCATRSTRGWTSAARKGSSSDSNAGGCMRPALLAPDASTARSLASLR